VPPEDAATLAALMTEADLRGSDTHGAFRLLQYIRRIRAGGVSTKPRMRVIEERAATAMIDGDNGMGHLVMKFAAATAIDKARTCGVGWAGVRRSNHAGPAALYAMMPLAHDMIGLYLGVSGINHMPPWGGGDALLGTNPLAVAVPAMEEPPVVLDMSPTVAAFGKVRLKASRGEEMPVGWMIDRAGKPLTDSARADEGFMVPIGEYKGYALALMIGLLAGTLNRASFGPIVAELGRNLSAEANTGQSVIAVSIAAFTPVDAFKRDVDRVVRTMRQAQRLPGVERIWLPGEQSHHKRVDRLAHGIPLSSSLRATLDDLARELKIDPLI
jgi:LDH2 family malate/lactate/ureidoglycolate dehydrogenase